MARSAVVSNVEYQLSFDLTDGNNNVTNNISSKNTPLNADANSSTNTDKRNKTQLTNTTLNGKANLALNNQFKATTKLTFNLASTKSPLTLDLNKAQVERFIINGKSIYPNYNGAYFTLSPTLLVSGKNTIEVSFKRQYSSNGEGLHRFIDPVDQRIYLYSHFEPAGAQKMFALFDQPDLKANFTLTVTAPKDWSVISTTNETRIAPHGTANTWYFPTTPKISPYNFSMHAGPYHVWQDNSGPYPMRLFARQSVAKHVSAADWFTYTKQGLRFFDNYFGIAYPFKKYDQLLVPNVIYGAMANAAAITFSEDYFLHQTSMTQAQKQSLASVIMHEMAQQWIGNLVTMRWWNGLWLNESFASFMGALATSEVTEFNHAWQDFDAKSKQQAYQKDRLITAHPIDVPVTSSHNAFDNIDAITYQKGASVLKQLRHLIGHDTFRQGVRKYLQQYRFENATLIHFIHSLETASGRDLSQWTQQWLNQAGVNTIKAQYVCGNGKISEFNLIQSANSDFPALREQRVQIALFNQHRHGIDKDKQLAVTYQGRKTAVPALIGSQCPDLVYPNIDNWGYVKVELDQRSLNTATRRLNHINDPLLRSMLWQSLWNSAVDGHVGVEQFINAALVNIPKEHDDTILSQVISHLHQAQATLMLMSPNHKTYANTVTRALAQMSLRLAMQNTHNSDLQRRWFEAYVTFSQTPTSLSHLHELLLGTATMTGMTLDQNLRWAIIKQLSRFDYKNTQQLIANELTTDNSNNGQKQALAARVLRPNAANKRQWLTALTADNTLTVAKKRIVMQSLYPTEQKYFSQATAQQRLDEMARYDQQGVVFMRAFNQYLIPTLCSADNIDALTKVISTSSHLSAMTQGALLEARQADYQCVQMKNTLKP
ncbi:aminopeptidase N [Shewanella intestini]|uniref:Aminopeptidase N n=2 Tax=Shewanellaceae TaxID=267890 RepID=A0ABS5I5S3_9GAMM|nr:aminopeptidase N [Shewanella intestini]MBR9729373.1 aminopeptidase N [Shewanella intestini]MRG37452.1 aminopeptidase N [Shewanella sp. XMDDZSB0408]